MTKKPTAIYLLIIGLLFMVVAGCYADSSPSQPRATPTSISAPPTPTSSPTATMPPAAETQQPTPTPVPVLFNGQRAYADILTQVALGPRVPGTEGHAKAQQWIAEELLTAGWRVEIQESEALGHPIENIVASRNDELPQLIIGAHYDTRIFADSDPDPAQQTSFVPGANDGASGVAVLLELARTLPKTAVPTWLVFFDAEDNGRIEGWDWILGSREFVKNNTVQPQAVIIVDMIGDADLNIYKEVNSNPGLTDEIWETARRLGYEEFFIPEYKHAVTDDHTPFLEAGLPAVDIIDFDYPYWHTIHDTPDKVSAESLQVVGETLHDWIVQQSAQP